MTVRPRHALLAICAIAIAAVTATSAPAASDDLTGRLSASLRAPQVSLARTAAIAVDTRTGAVVFAHNEDMPAIPASNEKLPVSWAALSRLGPGYRFATELFGVGARAGQTWDGDLYLRGGGDPTLSSGDIARLARSIGARGIRTITGKVRGDESVYDTARAGRGWKRSFLGIESPPLSALVVDRALGWPKHSPPLLAARALQDSLRKHGVAVLGGAGLGTTPAGALLLAVDHSARLATIAKAMNRDSDNFTAEMVLKQLGTVDGGLGTSARGAQVVIEEMRAARIPVTGVRIVDGSGLSSLDRVTAVALAGILRAGLENPRIRDAFVDSLAVAGRSGTLKNRLWKLTGLLRGKTGTTNLACTLSGVLNDSVVFVVLQNGSPVAFWPARVAQDAFVTALAASRYARTAAAG
jgi:D-alanyl-D-alanine carboxypeptidase/D-alanyl-D-alanine-endopeptidase (penicillin-binding protein 4)